MRKKYINNIMTIASMAYLIFFVIILIKTKITNKTFDLFDADGLAIVGSVAALLELLI